MLSRRNIRIKVMQMLYALSRSPESKLSAVTKEYNNNINSSFELYLFNLYGLYQVAAYAAKDAERIKAKHLPSEADKQFTPKLFDNPLVQSLRELKTLDTHFTRLQFDKSIDQEQIRKVYTSFVKTDDHKAYISNSETDNAAHLAILLKLYKHCIGHELFEAAIEDRFPCWVDDKSLIVGTVKKTLKKLPGEGEFVEAYRPGDDTVKDFGETMLKYVVEKDKDLLAIIEPTLKNWDVDRVAIIDMILLKMAITELLIFPTVPTKVTLNEYVEVSKLYSTDKSKDFINGILDRLLKKLDKEGKIKKEGRGLIG